MKCTFEKRKRFRVWVEPLEHNDPSTEPPVVELSLSVSHLVLGKTERGKNAVRTTSLPCACFFFFGSAIDKLSMELITQISSQRWQGQSSTKSGA